MADVFRLSGEFSAAPAVFDLGVQQPPETLGALLHTLYLTRRLVATVSLSGDAPVSVGLGALTGAHAIILQSTAKVRARLTSSDGVQQAVPVDPLAILLSRAVPVTALDLTRLSGTATEVQVFLGEKAT
jgi:hypothetical protein